MTDKEIKKIAAKISKCLALAGSSNAQEAEIAKRQADVLMKKYSLTTGDVAASQVNQKNSKAGGKYRPALWLCGLAKVIAKAFGCQAIINNGFGYSNSEFHFLGLGIKPELCSYTFDVLSRHLKKDRKQYLNTLKRYKRDNKIRMANIFCESWVIRIHQQVSGFAETEQEASAIKAYKQNTYGQTLQADTRERTKFKKNNDLHSAIAGENSARNISIHKPVHRKNNTLLN